MDEQESATSLLGRRLAWRSGVPWREGLEEQCAGDPVTAWRLLLRHRGLEGEEDEWFAPRLARLPDPLSMVDAGKAAARLITAMERGERVHIFGDFDADGVAATAVLVEGLRAAGLAVTWEVPHRSDQGHGIAVDSVRRQAASGCRVGISCDTGITCFAAAEAAAAHDMDLIITDHHLPEADGGGALPPAFAILNPARADCGFAGRRLCGCGVAFFLLAALWKLLRAAGRPPAYDLKRLLDRVALATIADMVELTGVNRILVHHGLARMQQQPSAGLKALLGVAGCDPGKGVRVETIAWQIAPRINAAGRMDHGETAVRLLLADDPAEAAALAGEMDALNRRRRSVEAETLRQVRRRLGDQGLIAAYDPKWHPGVVGLVAGKLARKAHRPAAIGYLDERETIHLSLRGVPGFHIQRLLADCSDLLDRFGGHAGAGGCALPKRRWSAFLHRFADTVSRQLAEGGIRKPPELIDLALTVDACHLALAERIARFEPTGEGNPPCRLLLHRAVIHRLRTVGAGALSLWMRAPGGAGIGAIAFRPGALAGTLREGMEVALVGRLERNDWNGNTTARFVVEDAVTP
ncbi:MAG: single-stranded-DNA-specific exonuclease RecJ [Zetaproteobacteria bacterium]|nr:MAG: single-stranded-DNA-specific exonuclease RecJ [Zetaproteobacteria bacterium]